MHTVYCNIPIHRLILVEVAGLYIPSTLVTYHHDLVSVSLKEYEDHFTANPRVEILFIDKEHCTCGTKVCSRPGSVGLENN